MDIKKLKAYLPEDIYAELYTILSYRTLTRNQLINFLANCEHESAGFKRFQENLNYSAKRLREVFPSRFRTLEAAQKVVNKGVVAIADSIYGGRMGNRKGTSDAFNFRGAGAIQLTGRSNYTLFDATVIDNIVENPSLVATKYKLRSALWFFDVNKLWILADKVDKKSIETLRKKINGGLNGIEAVRNSVEMYSDILKQT